MGGGSGGWEEGVDEGVDKVAIGDEDCGICERDHEEGKV